MISPPSQRNEEKEDYPIGFDETPPLGTDYSMTSGEKSVALTPYKKGWAMWNKYRDRARLVWNPMMKLAG